MDIGQFSAWGIALIGVILTLLNIADKSYTMKQRVSEPERKQDERIAALERQMEDMRRFLDNDKHAIEELKATMNITMKVQFAILSHIINDNDKSKLLETQKEMYNFLTSRGIDV